MVDEILLTKPDPGNRLPPRPGMAWLCAAPPVPSDSDWMAGMSLVFQAPDDLVPHAPAHPDPARLCAWVAHAMLQAAGQDARVAFLRGRMAVWPDQFQLRCSTRPDLPAIAWPVGSSLEALAARARAELEALVLDANLGTGEPSSPPRARI